MSEPWKGPKYDATRLLLLGESAYSWEENGEVQHPSPRHCDDLVEWAVNDFGNCRRESQFMTKLSRALANEESPSQERLRFVWDRVAFTNYVSETVGLGPRVRPTFGMWEVARQALPALLNDLRPSRVIVLGKQMWSLMPDSDIHITDDVQGYLLAAGDIAMCRALNHPSRGLSWRELAAVIHFAYQRELGS